MREGIVMAKNFIFVAGHNGLVGSAIVRQLKKIGHKGIITRTRQELDLRNQAKVEQFFQSNKISHVYLPAATVGGIYANNTYPADFIYDNLMIASNVIHAAWKSEVYKLLFLGSSCIYPKYAPQPISESALLTGPLESTNEPYAIAKIAGIKLCESFNRQYGTDFRSIMPTNLYGPNDNFHLKNSHVIPALIRKIHEAKINKLSSITLWGTGNALREFLFVDDLADACLHLMNIDKTKYQEIIPLQQSHINVGSGQEISIKNLAALIADICGYRGEILFDNKMPDGTPRKCMDLSLVNKLGWQASTDLKSGLNTAYEWFKKNALALQPQEI